VRSFIAGFLSCGLAVAVRLEKLVLDVVPKLLHPLFRRNVRVVLLRGYERENFIEPRVNDLCEIAHVVIGYNAGKSTEADIFSPSRKGAASVKRLHSFAVLSSARRAAP
jgi:hypothetical protein